MAHARPVFGMSDRKLQERLRALPPEGRLKVLLQVALGWRRLSQRHK